MFMFFANAVFVWCPLAKQPRRPPGIRKTA